VKIVNNWVESIYKVSRDIYAIVRSHEPLTAHGCWLWMVKVLANNRKLRAIASTVKHMDGKLN